MFTQRRPDLLRWYLLDHWCRLGHVDATIKSIESRNTPRDESRNPTGPPASLELPSRD